MADKKLIKKIAPIIMSVAVAMTGTPTGVFAEDFISGEMEAEISGEVADVSEEPSGDQEDMSGSEETADFEGENEAGFESGEEAAEEAGFEDGETEEAFTADAEGGNNNADGSVKTVEDGQIVLMNIPYEAFYRSELKNNDVKVDAFTSATKAKTKMSGVMNGNAAYHTSAEGNELAGVTFPVKVNKASDLENFKQITDSTTIEITTNMKGQVSTNTYTGAAALIEQPNYTYYVPAETPAYYKEMSVDENGNISFGAVQGMSEQNVSVNAELKLNSKYGDYQLELDETAVKAVVNASNGDKIYGVIINTTDGTTYALRHLENIWKGKELAWSTGFTTESHGCPISSDHYKSMMGKTISSVTYYTDKGEINFDIPDTYVPVKTGVSATVDNIKVTDAEVKVELSEALPSDYSKKYAVDDVEAATTETGVKVTNLTPGTHTLTISDANGKYAPVSATFTATTDTVMASYDEYEGKLVAAADITAEQFAAFTKTVSKVKIGDKEYAASGKGAVKIVQEDGTLDYSKTAVNDGDTVVVSAAGYPAVTFVYHENVYVYAGLTWAQYWAAENVLNAGSTASSDTADRRGEKDLGAFDEVTRATSNHGLHRGSFQTIATIYTKAGNSYKLAGWKDKSTMILTDGSTAAFGRGTVNGESIDHYVVSGLKYVPVKVKRADYSALKEAYTVVENGGTLFGGFGENNLAAYTATAAVNDNTNGLKTAVRAEDGSFTFSARVNGSDSGLKDTAQKTADGITATVKPGSGSYGEFLRVDLTGNYGGLGEAMQAVKWTYYGNDSTYSTPLQSYGTKFASDNWMHKMMGIQLGLSDSLRCQLPEGYDGTGYWTLTVYGLGYADYTVKFQATSENIAKPAGDADSTPLENIIAEAKALNEADYTSESWAAAKDNIANELEECEDMLANIKQQTTYGVEEQIGHLREALNSLVKAEFKLSAETVSLDTDKNKTAALKVTTNLTGDVTWKSSDEKTVTVDKNGNVTAVKAGTATITATLGLKSAACKVTVKEVVKPTPTPAPTLTAKAKNSVIYTKGLKSTRINVTKVAISGTVKYTSSNKKVATVSSKGVVTAKKAGKTVITVKAGKYTAKVTIQVKKPTLKLAKSSATIKKGKSVTIKATAAPKGTVKYKSSNKKVATVSSKGVVKGKKKGTATITVTCNGVSKKFKVKVK
nr:penicillin-binding Tp47 domain C-containing protein [uncultured Blautia sp.]